jgi:hypothetical protein
MALIRSFITRSIAGIILVASTFVFAQTSTTAVLKSGYSPVDGLKMHYEIHGFYLYSPFTGSILADVLERLRKESTRRPIKICTLGPCTCTVAQESWLRASALPHPVQITVFQPYF